MKQTTLSAGSFELYGKTTRREVFGRDRSGGAPEATVCTDRTGLSKGRKLTPPVGLERMLRIHFLQNWFKLSDPAVEAASTSYIENRAC